MHSARTGYRKAQDEELLRLRQENTSLKLHIAKLEEQIGKLTGQSNQSTQNNQNAPNNPNNPSNPNNSTN